MTLFFYIDLFYFGKYTTKWVKVEWDILKYISTSYLKHYLYNIMKIKCSFTILLMVKKEFKNPKGFERMTCGGIIGTTSTYFGTLLIIIIERKNYINLFDLIFNVYFERDSVTRYVTNTPLQPYLFSSFEEIKSTRLCVGLLVSLPQILSACLFVFTIYNSQIITH